MNSSTSRSTAETQKREEIKRQIALLQASLGPETVQEHGTKPTPPPKRKTPEPMTLAPATPSPKKRRKLDHKPSMQPPLLKPVFKTVPQQGSSKIAGGSRPSQDLYFKPAPSKLISNLAAMGQRNIDVDVVESIPRSTGFTEKPKEIEPVKVDSFLHQKRDERLALVDDLEPGPYEHTPPSDDPTFDKLEPHSGISLLSRSIPHEEFADHFRGRFYLSPSRLYSSIRLLPDKQGYDVPVPGDWITVAVVAERGPIKFTRAPVTLDVEAGDNDPKKHWKRKEKPKEGEKPKALGKKYVNIKLIDFGARSNSKSLTTGGTAVIRGDAFLTLLLFESDAFDMIPKEDGGRPEKVYRGGSRGAFENLTNLKEGDVIALLNPKILKPFQRSNDTPHPVDNILAITPESASSIMVIGRSKDLGMCTVRKQDGKVCGSWCDKRASDVCEYHVQSAVQRRRAARPEFSVGTSGMSTSSSSKRKAAFDPSRQWGLKPEDGSTGDGATYVISGHVVSGTSSDPRTMYVSETIGREGQARAQRKAGGKDAADKALKKLLERDKEGMRAVMRAREVGDEGDEQGKGKGKSKDKSKGGRGKKDVRSGKAKGKKDSDFEDEEEDTGGEEMKAKSSYSAGIIKSLGFDPSFKAGQRRLENNNVQNKLEALEAVRTSRRDIILKSRPGPKIRSGVTAPKRDQLSNKTQSVPGGGAKDVELCDLESDDDGLPPGVMQVPIKQAEEEKMIDLDDF
ncbi:hypothetical protein B0H34DRAFT_80664 [Crassisporium funariophilum]|nr:hypothetical protein B0H34DRAFT_80664 [Crassisporium funariophilum]